MVALCDELRYLGPRLMETTMQQGHDNDVVVMQLMSLARVAANISAVATERAMNNVLARGQQREPPH